MNWCVSVFIICITSNVINCRQIEKRQDPPKPPAAAAGGGAPAAGAPAAGAPAAGAPAAGAPAAGAPAAGGATTPKKCIKCKSYDDCAKRTSVMDCNTEEFKDIGFDKEEKKFLDKLLEGNADGFDKTTAINCLTIQFDKNEMRGCGPAKVKDQEICAYIKSKGKNVTCVACAAAETPCNNGTSLKEKKKSNAVKIGPGLTVYFWVFSLAMLKMML